MARGKRQYLVDEKGRKTAVVLPVKEYAELLEDLGDLAEIAERRNEPAEPIETVTGGLENNRWRSIKRLAERDAPCPCNSGISYQECCFHEPYEWLIDKEGNFYLSIRLSSPKVAKSLKEEVGQLLKRHAARLGLHELVFPGWSPERIDAIVVDNMKRAGIDPAIIYAYQKTGWIVTCENKRTYTRSELRQYQNACNEYRHLAEQGNAPVI